MDEEIERVHVYPLFGREHEISLDCWCHPLFSEETPELEIVIHNVMQ